ncbi:MAG: hypothetical protein AB1Z98_36290 [Nannocystaceae bacterium]
MRINVEQFLALTMALGTAGAVGVAVYSNHEARAEAEAEPAAEPAESVEAEEPFPEAPPDPPPAATPAPAMGPSPAPMPSFDAEPEQLDAAPGPQVESMNW